MTMPRTAGESPTPAEPTPTCSYVRVLTIAGSDSGGGAGIQADLKTFAALGCYGMSAITALTAQNTCGVRAIHAVPAEFVKLQIDAVVDDLGVDAVKIGMLHSAAVVATVAEAIERHALRRVVLDPVMVSTSGAVLIEQDAIDLLVRELFPRVDLVTPNLDEAALLLGRAIESADQLERAADDLLALGARAVLLKGGHLPGLQVVDLLAQRNAPWQRSSAPRIASRNLHGTGCTLSSAVAAHLALGLELPQAVEAAQAYVRAALQSGAAMRIGAGSGPLNHGHAPRAMQLRPLGQ